MKSFAPLAKSYLFATYAAGLAIFALEVGRIDLKNPVLLLVLCVLGSLAEILKVVGSTERSHYTFSLMVYSFTFVVFGPAEAMLVIVVSRAVQWIWSKPPWFAQLFNAASYIVVIEAAGVIYRWVNPSHAAGTWLTALAIILSMAAFNLLNHVMVGLVVWLADGENFKKSGIFDFFPLMLDLTLLYFGASLSIVWHFNPFALALFAVPIYLISSTLRVPALKRRTELDSKTGLFNHDYFMKQLANELARADRFDRPLSVVTADLDVLRNINNSYGHLAGDQVLIGLATFLKESVRDYDVVSRFGGDEFSILLPETSLSEAFERAELMRTAIENMEFTVPTSVTPIHATMSFGVSERQSFGQSPDEILHNGDVALYHSKLKGRNRCSAYSDEAYWEFPADNTKDPPLPAARHIAGEDGRGPGRLKTSEEVQRPAASEAARPPSKDFAEQARAAREKQKSRRAAGLVGIFITTMASAALLAFLATVFWLPPAPGLTALDWVGLLVICSLIALSEGYSIDLYNEQASVSTSAIPILVAYLLFGPIGIAGASLVVAVALLLKYRSHASRFVFNLGNHILAGALIWGLVALAGSNLLALPPLHQLTLSLAAGGILYLVTTCMVACGISLDLGQPAWQVWKEQFSWLAPYYLGLGFIGYALIFGYRYDHIMGLLLMLFPMVILRISQKQYMDRTRQVVTEVREKNQALKATATEIADLNEGLLATLSDVIDLRDPYVLGHSKRVCEYALAVARLMGLHDKQIDLIRKASLLHDIGKLGVPMDVLTKAGDLTREEYELMKRHAAVGAALIENSPPLRNIVPIIRHHHEHYDGGGYPDGLAENEIPIEARIVAVADAVEAMSSDRPYRGALSPKQVADELNRCSGSQFDPLVVREAIKLLEPTTAARSEVPALSGILESALPRSGA